MEQTRFIYVLSNDYPSEEGFNSEHGLAILIKLDKDTYWLWDTGQSSLFFESAKKLGLDLKNLKGVALSHGHYDHSGGLPTLLGETGFQGPIFAHPGCGNKRFKFQSGQRPRQIGLDTVAIPWPPPGFRAASKINALDNGLTMISQIRRRPGFHESVGGYFFDLSQKNPDQVDDDACLVLSSQGGPVIILGCCHSGLANTLYHVRDLLGVASVFSVAGGLHLLGAAETSLQEAVEVLKEFSVQKVYPCHCTGSIAIDFLKNRLPGKVFEMGTGTKVAF